MAKRESTLINMVATLLIVTLVVSTALGYVYELTKAPIAAAKLAKKTKAVEEVLPPFDNNPVEEMYKVASDGKDSLELYPAKKDGKLVGTAIKTYTGKGFSGEIILMVGFDNEGNIVNTSVLDHKETPGLGSKMSDGKFKDQFPKKNPEKDNLKVTKDGGTIDAISGATITSRAFGDAIARAYEAFKEGGKK